MIVPVYQPSQRRRIKKDGVTYEEVLPGDETTLGEDLCIGAVILFIVMPVFFAIFRWVLIPIFGFIFDGRFSWSP